MEKLNPDTVATPPPGYSQGVRVGDTVYVAGQTAADVDWNVVGPGDIAAQTRQTLKNVEAVVAASGLGVADIASATVYIRDLADYPGFKAAWTDFFGAHSPARTTVRADLVHPDLLVEVQAVATR